MLKIAYPVGRPHPGNLASLLHYHFDLQLSESSEAAQTLVSCVISEGDPGVKTQVREALRRDTLEVIGRINERYEGTSATIGVWGDRLSEYDGAHFFHGLLVCKTTVLVLEATAPTTLRLVIFRRHKSTEDEMMLCAEFPEGESPWYSFPGDRVPSGPFHLNAADLFVKVREE